MNATAARHVIRAALACIAAAFVAATAGCAADATSGTEDVGSTSQAVCYNSPCNNGTCDPSTQCCFTGHGSASGQCLADLQAQGCKGFGVTVGGDPDTGTWFFDMGCPIGLGVPPSCVAAPFSGAKYAYSHCTGHSGVAVDPNCPSGCTSPF